MANIIRRIYREFEDLDQWRHMDIKKDKRNRVYNIPIFEATMESTRKWLVDILIPGNTLKLEVVFPNNYPFVAPRFKLLSYFKHDCIADDGMISVISNRDWSPALTAGPCLLIIATTLFSDFDEMMSEERQINRVDIIKRELCERTGFVIDFTD